MQAIPAAGKRARLYARLQWRNRLVDVLRWGLAAIIVAGLGLFAGQMWLAGLPAGAGGARIAVQRGALIIDKPHYQGVTADGTRYRVTAREGESAITAPDMLRLSDAELELTRRDGTRFFARTAKANYNLLAQTVTAAGTVEANDNRGTRGVLENAAFDWSTQTLHAKDGARLVFADGTRLEGTELTYYAAQSRWVFKGAQMQTGTP